MKRRTVVINSVLGVAVVGVATAAGLSISNAGDRATPTGQTVAVQRGTVTATVSATGNVEAGTSVSVAMAGSASGTVTKIYAREGRPVKKGDRLLAVDATAAKRSLKTAEANLDSAQAQLTTATQGRSSADQEVDDSSVASAQTTVTNARTAAAQARRSYRLDHKQQNALVSSADDAVDEAEDQLSDDRARLKTAQAAGDPTQVATLQTTVAGDESAVTSAKASRTQSRQTWDKTLLSGRQAIQTQDGQVDSAEDTLAAQTAQRAANAQPARQGAVDSAQASVDSAQVSVDEARTTLADTTLRAPVDGTVVDVSAVVGESSSGSGGSTSSSAGSSTATGTSGTSGAGATSAAGTDTSGLVTLATTDAKQVSASVAEADVVKVKKGQSATVAFPASGRTLTGRVTAIASQSTVTDNVVQYAVTVSLPSAGPSIRLGQTADVTITASRHAGTLYVPTSALTTANGRTTVTRRANGADATVEVRTGLVGSVGTEVVRGLGEGDLLVLPAGNDSQAYTFPGSAPAGSSASPSSSSSPR